MEGLLPLCVLWYIMQSKLVTLKETMWTEFLVNGRLNESMQYLAVHSELILCRFPALFLRIQVTVPIYQTHASVITCIHIIWKKLNKSIPWFIPIDLIKDLIDDLINLIKSMPTLTCILVNTYIKSCFVELIWSETINRKTTQRVWNEYLICWQITL